MRGRSTVSVNTSALSSAVSSRYPSRAPSPPTRRQPFRFFDLPSELRLRIYEEVLVTGAPLDLDPMNYRQVHPRLRLFLVSHRMHEEACRVFYSQPMRLYPVHGRFFHTKKPLLARLSPRYRAEVQTMDLRLGPGWSAPPRGQNTNTSLGLADCTSFRILKIFIECDPSDSVFAGFRGKGATEHTYRRFCLALLQGIVEQVPSLEVVEIDGYPAVNKSKPLVMSLRKQIKEQGKRLVWSPLREWEEEDGGEPGLDELEKALAEMKRLDELREVEIRVADVETSRSVHQKGLNPVSC